jgi:LL-diaminopimelate aminotransferase
LIIGGQIGPGPVSKAIFYHKKGKEPMRQAKRLDNTPPYVFVEIENKIAQLRNKGVDVIDIAIGDPDTPTPDFVINRMVEALRCHKYFKYPEYDGCMQFRRAAANYYQRRFGVSLDPETEVLALLGSKEGIAHIFFALVNDGDFTLIPDPQYPVYTLATSITGGIAYPLPLLPENGFLPDFSSIPTEVLKRAKILFLNYPNNPTGAVANLDFYKKAIELGKKYGILVCNDNAYSEFAYEGIVSPSILQVPGAMDSAIEFHTLSKSYNMTGWRLGYVVGNRDAIGKLMKMKHNIDSGVFTAVQIAGAEALENGDSFVKKMADIYKSRRQMAFDYLKAMNLRYVKPQGTFYIWINVPEGFTSMSFASHILENCGVVVTPGVWYGKQGEGYIRISLTASDDRIREAFERMKVL